MYVIVVRGGLSRFPRSDCVHSCIGKTRCSTLCIPVHTGICVYGGKRAKSSVNRWVLIGERVIPARLSIVTPSRRDSQNPRSLLLGEPEPGRIGRRRRRRQRARESFIGLSLSRARAGGRARGAGV